MRISDWSSDVCSSDLGIAAAVALLALAVPMLANLGGDDDDSAEVASESAQETADDSAGSDEASGEESAADEEASTSVAEDYETLYETAPASRAGGRADTDNIGRETGRERVCSTGRTR